MPDEMSAARGPKLGEQAHHLSQRRGLQVETFLLALAAGAVSAAVTLTNVARPLTNVVTPLGDAVRLRDGVAGVTPLLVFFCFVWALWLSKFLLARSCSPAFDRCGVTSSLRTSVIAPVYNESEELFRRVLTSVQENRPAELIVVVDGADPALVRIASDYTDRVLAIPKSGKRQAIASGFAAADPGSDVIVILDSDTIWEPGMLSELLLPFADGRVGGVTPKQSIFDRRRSLARRMADWIEDLRYSLTVPAQSVLGQVGCLAGRTIAFRRDAFVPAVEELVEQRVLGVEMSVGDDRVLTNVLLRNGWRTVYQPTARVQTDAPDRWTMLLKQQLRWGRSSQRETLLCLPWLWRRPYALLCFASDILIPLALYGLVCSAVANVLAGDGRPAPLLQALLVGYAGMLLSLGVRQVPHFRRYPSDALLFPVFALALTVVMAPVRLVALATMFHNEWGTRPDIGTHEVEEAVVRA